MKLPQPRGALSAWTSTALSDGPRLPKPPRIPADPLTLDAQLALWTMYELHYRGFDDARPGAEWDPEVLGVRAALEDRFERTLRDLTAPALSRLTGGDIEDQLRSLIDSAPDSGLATWLHREATFDQFREFMRLRSIYHLKESDPQSWLLARIDGPAKVALAELQYDEYGAGRPEMLHQKLFADALAGCGLSTDYGAYLADVDAETLAVNNAMSLFALNHRLRGAGLGHLAAFEATSSIPCRRICQGIERLGLPASVGRYFDEHVEADAAHEQVAIGDICGSLVHDQPDLAEDVRFGAATCLLLDARAGDALLARWRSDAEVRAS